MSNINELKLIIDSQKEMIGRYDNKAASYINISANTFVIALFTMCIFEKISDGSLARKSDMFIMLLIIMIIYCLCFTIAIILSLVILFPRGNINKKDVLENSITNFEGPNTSEQINYYLNNQESIFKEQIISNNVLLNIKNKYAKIIIYPITIKCICLIMLLLLIFFI